MDFFRRQMPMFSSAEQGKVQNMSVLIAGAGGLGTHQALELQRLGIKKIYLVDYDKIVPSNLNRQILYGRDDIGKYKVERACSKLTEFDLDTELVPLRKKVDENLELGDDIDLVFDAFDNFKSRFQLEKLAQKHTLPLIHGGVSSWYGQITTIIPNKTPSLKEIFGETSEPEGEIPVLSPVVSIIASLQVVEGIKVYLEREGTLINKLLLVDLTDYSFNIVDL